MDKDGLVHFDELFRQHFPFVWRCLRGLGVPEADADDVAQEVFLVVHRRLHEFGPEREMRPWLYGVLRLVMSNYRRKVRRTRVREQALALEPRTISNRFNPAASLEDREAASLVNFHLERLEPNRREVFVLVELEEMPVTMVAATLGIPLNTAYSRLRLAREDFKASLSREAGR